MVDPAKGLMRTALWTELRDALRKDFPGLSVPQDAPPNITIFVCTNADYISELTKKNSKGGAIE